MLDGRKGLVTIFGGSGFVGTQLVQILAHQGYRIRVAVRRPDLAGHLRPLGAVGQVVPMQANLRDPQSVRHAIEGADVVVNLVGILFESGKQKFETIQDKGARLIAETALGAGVKRLVHMSAIGADLNSPSAYAASKARGEAGVLDAFPDAQIMRPSLIFGADDGFFNLFGNLARLSPILPLVGEKTRFQPVYVGDVADAFAAAVNGAGTPGTIYEFGGPDIETMRVLMERLLREVGRDRLLMVLPSGLARLQASLMQLLPKPMLTVDQVIQLQRDNVVSEAAKAEGRTLAAFGVQPTAMDGILPSYLWQYRKHGEFDRVEA